MSQNESTTFLVTDAKNLTLIDEIVPAVADRQQNGALRIEKLVIFEQF